MIKEVKTKICFVVTDEKRSFMYSNKNQKDGDHFKNYFNYITVTFWE